jgi:hypothetical protein
MRVLFMNDSTTHPNWGGRAATISLRMMISQAGGDIVKTITIDDLERSSLDDHDTSGEGHPANADGARETLKLFIPPVLLKLRRRYLRDANRPSESLIPQTWGDYDRCARRVLGEQTPWPRLLRSFEGVDVAVVFGDGDIYGNGVLPRSLLFLSYILKKHFSKPVIMVNHSADFGHPDLSRAAQEVYPLFDDVVFRDRVSLERCKSLCEGRFAADTAFWFKPAARQTWVQVTRRPTYFDFWPDTASFSPSKPYVCLGGSDLAGHVGDREREAMISGYGLLVKRLQSSYAGQIVLTASDWSDQSVFRVVSERFKLPMIGIATPVQQAVDVLGNADAYIGGRYHPSVLALRGGTPIVPLASKSFKMQALTCMAGLPSETSDPLNLADGVGAIERQLSGRLGQGEDLRRKLTAWADDMAQDSWANVDYLRSLR